MNNELFLNRRMLVLRSARFRGEERRKRKIDENLTETRKNFSEPSYVSIRFENFNQYVFAMRNADEINFN